MKRILLFFVFLFLFLIVPVKHSYAAFTVTYSPAQVNLGQSVQVTINGIDLNHPIGMGVSTWNGIGSPPVIESWNFNNCSNIPNNGAWTNITCTQASDGTYKIVANFNTQALSDQLGGVIPGETFSIYVDLAPAGGGTSFQIGTPTPTSFSIKSASPNPAKEGDTVRITIDNATSGHEYTVAFDGRELSHTTCSTLTCDLNSFTVPYVANQNVKAMVLDKSTNQSLDSGISFMLSDIGPAGACLTCPVGSTYDSTKTPKGCYSDSTHLQVAPSNQRFCLPNETCPIQGKGCVANSGGGNPVNCPSGNCTGVSYPLPRLSALALAMVPKGGVLTLGNIISVAISLLILIAIILCLLYLLWGGFNWITSEGDKTRLESARQKIIYAILGLVIVFCSFLAINLIYQFFFKHLATGIGG